MKIDEKNRKNALSILAKSALSNIVECWDSVDIDPVFSFLKKPEVGMVMVRAKAGGDGQQFNMGEMTVTRCVIQLDSKEIGYGYTSGRNPKKSKIIAVIDACFQVNTLNKTIENNIISPLENILMEKESKQKNKVDSSKVDFFTMVRGE